MPPLPRSAQACARVLAAVLVAGVVAPEASADQPDGDSFWSRATTAHDPEVVAILEVVRHSRGRAASEYAPYDHTGFARNRAANHQAILVDALAMLHHALEIEPQNPMLLRELGYVTGELGQASESRRAFEAYLSREAPERVAGEVRLHLARIHAVAGRHDRAVRELRLALGGRFEDELRQRSHAVHGLALLLMHDDRLAEAIDLLRAHTGGPLRYGYGESLMLQFALAVAYDRDEQITRAHDALAQITGLGEESLTTVLFDSSAQPVFFAPSIDRHYFAALQYEAMGHLPEARRAWSSYAASGPEARFRDRALDHIEAIDRLRSAP